MYQKEGFMDICLSYALTDVRDLILRQQTYSLVLVQKLWIPCSYPTLLLYIGQI